MASTMDAEVTTTPIERRPARTQGQRIFALALMTTAGWCDAAGFLLFGGLFVSFMSGDATRLGLSAGDGHWMAAAKFLSAQAVFVLGVAFGRSVRLWRPARGRRDLLVVNAALLGATALLGDVALGLPGFVLAVAAMGAQNATMTQEFGVPIGTMVTGALARLGANVADWLRGMSSDLVDNLTQWTCFVLGALGGTIAFRTIGQWGFLVPAAINVVLIPLAARLPAMVPEPQGRLT